jgi:hypothetical protein
LQSSVLLEIEEQANFKFGRFYLGDSSSDIYSSNHTALLRSCLQDEETIVDIQAIFSSAVGLSLLMVQQFSICRTQFCFDMSHSLNTCSAYRNREEKEVLFHISLSLWPENAIVAKNLAYNLETAGIFEPALDVYQSSGFITSDPGLLIHELSCAPVLFSEYSTVTEILDRLDKNMHLLLSKNFSYGVKYDNPMFIIRDIPMNIQYVGRNPAWYYTVLSKSITPISADLEVSLISLTNRKSALLDLPIEAKILQKDSNTNTVRIGIVSGIISI